MTQTRLCFEHPAALAPFECAHCQRAFCDACRVESVLLEAEFCSERCRLSAEEQAHGRGGPSEQDLLRGADRPIRTGWALWWRSIPGLVRTLLPLALIDGVLALVLPPAGADGTALHPLRMAWIGVGMALSGVVLSRAYIGFDPGNVYAWTLRRLVPWAVTWLVVAVTSFIGFLLLIVPGMWVAIRLFYADEFALVHARSPGAAIRESFELTRGNGADVFVFQFMLGFAQYALWIPAAVLLIFVQMLIQGTGSPDAAPLRFLGAVFTYTLILLAYASAHGPELTFFYGLRARVRADRTEA